MLARGVPATPGADPPATGLSVLDRQIRVRGRPGRRVFPDDLGARATRSSGHRLIDRGGVETAVAAEADQHGDRHGAHLTRQVVGGIGRVADAGGGRRVSRLSGYQGVERLGGDRLDRRPRLDPPHGAWGCPPGAPDAELGEPLVRPAGAERLPSRRAGRRGRDSPLGAGRGSTARPDARGDRGDWRAVGERLARQPGPASGRGAAAIGQGGRPAAPAASVGCRQTRVGQGSDQTGRQRRVRQLKERLTAALAARGSVRAAGVQRFQGQEGQQA